jgi:hypothetical protein
LGNLRLLVCLGGTLCPVFASGAEGARFELSWQAPQNCPDGTAVTHEVLELVAGAASDASKPVIVASGSVVADREGFGLVLTIRDAEGAHVRRLEAPSCDELGHAAALIVALAINPALLATHSDPGGDSPSGTAVHPPNTAATPAAPSERPLAVAPRERLLAAPALSAPFTARNTETTPDTTPAEPLRWRLGLSEFVALRTLPGTNLGTALFGALHWRALRLETSASQLRAEVAANKPNAGAAFALYRFAAKGCWLTPPGKWAFGPCAGAEIGLVHGRGYGVDTSTVQNGLWVAATLGALLEWRVASSSFVGITADAELPAGDKFELANATIFEPRISGKVGASLAAGW